MSKKGHEKMTMKKGKKGHRNFPEKMTDDRSKIYDGYKKITRILGVKIVSRHV